jgi:arylsulfatase A
VMMELDWSIGEIMKALSKAGVEKDTIVVFTSDNGPWLPYGNHSGKTPYRESKGTAFDGGVRSACIVRYPGRVPAGRVSGRTFCSIDLMPTVATRAGARLPDNPIDGRDVWDLITGKDEFRNPHDYYAFSTGARFDAVMSGDGRWKLHVPHPYNTVVEPGMDGRAGKVRAAQIETSLFDLQSDPMESDEVSAKYPDVLAKMQGFADEHRKRFWST